MSGSARLTIAAGLACLAAAGCGSDRPSRGEGTVRVVATNVVLADLASNAGGRRVLVEPLVPRVADVHTWRPGPGARAALEDADLVVSVGGRLDRWLGPLLAERPGLRHLELLPRLDPLGGDPHFWHDPVRVQRAVKEIRNELAREDVDGAGYYEAAAGDFLARLRRIDQDTRFCVDVVDGRGRRVLAQHAGFRYFAARYGVRVLGPREGRATVGRRLWADTLARRGEPAGTYLGAFAANVASLSEALSGGSRTCRPRA